MEKLFEAYIYDKKIVCSNLSRKKKKKEGDLIRVNQIKQLMMKSEF